MSTEPKAAAQTTPPTSVEAKVSSSEGVKGEKQEQEMINSESMHGQQEKETKKSKSSIPEFLASHLPPWVVKNLTTPRSIKVLLRCWLASWVAYVLILPNASLNTLGSAAFFTVLCSFFLPPSLPVQLFIFMMSTLVIGLLLGWGFGVAAMRAANASRSQALLRAATAQLQNSIQNNPALQANPTLAQTSAVFHGLFLDRRSSAVYGCFLGLAVFLFGLLRAYTPKLTLMSIFGTIAVDIFCSIGPLFPTFQPTLLNSLLISVASYTAIALVLTVFVFPETMSHSVLRAICEQVERAEGLVRVQDEVLKAGKQGDMEELSRGGKLMGRIVGTRSLVVAVQKQLMTTSAFMSLEFSYGRWSSDDVKNTIESLLVLVTRVGGLQSFAKLVGQTVVLRERKQEKDASNASSTTTTTTSSSSPSSSSSSSSSSSTTPPRPPAQPSTSDTRLLSHITTINTELETVHGVRLADVLPIIEDATKELRTAVVDGLACVRSVLVGINSRRWRGNKTKQKGSTGAEEGEGEETELKRLDEAIERLKKAREVYVNEGRGRIVEPFTPLLKKEGEGTSADVDADADSDSDLGPDADTSPQIPRSSAPLRSLFIANVFSMNILAVSYSVVNLLEYVRKTSAKRRRRRLWAPGGLTKIWKLIRSRGGGARGEEGEGKGWDDEGVWGEDERRKENEQEEKEENYRLDPDSRPPTNVLQKVMNGVHELYRWTKTAEAMFAFKYVFVTIALWLPSVVKRTAYFYYDEKGVWALIMAQTTLNIYAADQIFNLITRLAGTFVGLVVGLVAWYMGNGHGIGNPYGAAAATGLGILPLIFVRLFAPPQYAAGIILTCATFALVVGYSWVDGHVSQFASPGIGWSVAWKRFTLVVIGSAASFIMMMLPPTSGRKAVRYRNASSIANISALYGYLISAWISGDALVEREKDKRDSSKGDLESDGTSKATNADERPPPKWVEEFRVRLVGVADEIAALRALTGIAKWEGSIRGKWPAEEYEKLVDVQSEMVSALAQLGGALSHLDDEWRVKFLHSTRVLNPNFITEVMTVFSLVSQSLRTTEPLHQVLPQNLVERLFYHHHSHSHHHHTSPSNGLEQYEDITFERVSSVDYMYYAGGVVAVFQLLQSLDEIHQIVKKLCGEVPLKGFMDWRDQFDRSHVQV